MRLVAECLAKREYSSVLVNVDPKCDDDHTADRHVAVLGTEMCSSRWAWLGFLDQSKVS